jgi:hypothetical protein
MQRRLAKPSSSPCLPRNAERCAPSITGLPARRQKPAIRIRCAGLRLPKGISAHPKRTACRRQSPQHKAPLNRTLFLRADAMEPPARERMCGQDNGVCKAGAPSAARPMDRTETGPMRRSIYSRQENSYIREPAPYLNRAQRTIKNQDQTMTATQPLVVFPAGPREGPYLAARGEVRGCAPVAGARHPLPERSGAAAPGTVVKVIQ